MRKFGAICAAVAVGMFFSIPAFAGDWADGEGSCYHKGVKIVSAGGSIVPFGAFVGFDYGLHDAISLGGATGFNTSGYNASWRYNQVPILVRGAFHPFNLALLAEKVGIRNKLDVYVGLAAGWGIGFWSYEGAGAEPANPRKLGLILREYIGAKFFITPNFGFVLEDCAGLGVLNGGVCFAF